MVLSKEDFKKKIDTLEISDDKKIEILEDIEDSWTDDVNAEYKARYEAEKKEMEASIANLEAETASLKAKYKERFFNSDSVENKEDITEDIEEKKVIDVKEI
jgi:hypothetical protein